jgi:type IV secretion system protein VirB11
MSDETITEVCVNRPGEVFIERASRWEHHECEALTLQHLVGLATATAKYHNGQDINEDAPILSAVLPGKERIQIVRPPACEHGTYSLTIRKPSLMTRSLSDYAEQGFFKHVRPVTAELTPGEFKLKQHLAEGDYLEFLRAAVLQEKVIVVAGETGSGKTTFMKALMQVIPTDQRIITIEDTPELFLPAHPNHVHLFYPAGAKDDDPLTAAALLKSCLRMKPTRILLAELRGGETYDFLNVAASGHGGSITSCHAGSCELAFERMALMVQQNRQGRELPYDAIRRLLHLLVDVVVHVTNDVHHGGIGRHITEVWFQPERKRQAMAGGQ